jgi:hypothetical protein
MNADQRAGALILVAACAAISISLVLSEGWSVPSVPLYLFSVWDFPSIAHDADLAWLKAILEFLGLTRNVVAMLLAWAAYGVCRYLSLLPALSFRRSRTRDTAGG